ncbi:hypothetical protein A3G62_02450 [Candidatus Kaiserbacteria bacterium RIFCSPLOWO2_12_FULL_50_10]|nr:MAG: hypothetical protein A3G62_02450 [Candidatus Kaiserbacteria bacterium RIFCSPLOWO2_12_FULL_50_10]
MKAFLQILVIGLIIWGVYALMKNDEYLGFYYPDANNLSEDISSIATFDSLESCRDWVDEQVSIFNPDGTGYDYECGKNCDAASGKPYVCEETLR